MKYDTFKLTDIYDEQLTYRDIDRINYISEYINSILEGRKKNTKENVFRLVRKNFPSEPPKTFMDFTFFFVNDIIDNIDEKEKLNNKSVFLKNSEVYDIANINSEEDFETLTYSGKFKWNDLKRYYYKMYMDFYNQETI